MDRLVHIGAFIAEVQKNEPKQTNMIWCLINEKDYVLNLHSSLFLGNHRFCIQWTWKNDCHGRYYELEIKNHKQWNEDRNNNSSDSHRFIRIRGQLLLLLLLTFCVFASLHRRWFFLHLLFVASQQIIMEETNSLYYFWAVQNDNGKNCTWQIEMAIWLIASIQDIAGGARILLFCNDFQCKLVQSYVYI